jgi:hypothetical protein
VIEISFSTNNKGTYTAASLSNIRWITSVAKHAILLQEIDILYGNKQFISMVLGRGDIIICIY